MQVISPKKKNLGEKKVRETGNEHDRGLGVRVAFTYAHTDVACVLTKKKLASQKKNVREMEMCVIGLTHTCALCSGFGRECARVVSTHVCAGVVYSPNKKKLGFAKKNLRKKESGKKNGRCAQFWGSRTCASCSELNANTRASNPPTCTCVYPKKK